jgi:hypothetical protein
MFGAGVTFCEHFNQPINGFQTRAHSWFQTFSNPGNAAGWICFSEGFKFIIVFELVN